jgi:endonuclease/exonuclease/phosphatase family metal-dependent hydrolase
VILPNSTLLHVLAYHATTPAFDGPEDFNGRRNHDENAFWLRYLEGALQGKPPLSSFVILGDANLDPADGDGRRQAVKQLLALPLVRDPKPNSRGAVAASATQAGVNAIQSGDAALDTADWRDTNGPGNLRVDYVLPSRDLSVSDAGVYWPAPDEPGWDILSSRNTDVSWHGLVWVDISR